MALTAAQKTTLKADIAANTNTIPVGRPFEGTAINALPNTGDANFEIALWYSLIASPDFWVFRTNIPSQEIHDKVTWANFTPEDAITAANAAEWTARSMSCQGKQFNLQIMLQGSTFNAGNLTSRGGLNDATTNLPSGVSGASKSGGWAGILPILRRLARNIEKLFAVATTGVGTGTGALGATGNPGLMGYEGSVSLSDIESARNS